MNPYISPFKGRPPEKDREVLAVPQEDGSHKLMEVDSKLATEIRLLLSQGKDQEARTIVSWFL
jgi:hypothetical protein